MNRILVALDGSEHSKKAVELAVDLAKTWKAELYMIHVLEEKKAPEGFEEYAKAERISPTDYFKIVCEKARFVGEAEARAKAAGLEKVKRICTQGDPADEILKTADSNKVDLIVMGSRGLGGFSRAFMGSVSTKVCNHARCSCITVK